MRRSHNLLLLLLLLYCYYCCYCCYCCCYCYCYCYRYRLPLLTTATATATATNYCYYLLLLPLPLLTTATATTDTTDALIETYTPGSHPAGAVSAPGLRFQHVWRRGGRDPADQQEPWPIGIMVASHQFMVWMDGGKHGQQNIKKTTPYPDSRMIATVALKVSVPSIGMKVPNLWTDSIAIKNCPH